MQWQTLAVWLIIGMAFIAVCGRILRRHLYRSRRNGSGNSSCCS